MTQQKHFRTWSALEAHIQQFSKRNSVVSGLGFGHYSHLLFRGQGDAGWKLETTLERIKPKFSELSEYYRRITVAKTQIESFTGKNWGDIDYLAAVKALSDYDSLRAAQLPAYEYLVYLRHHGFPSPLLDWSRSLYVAAYFAFCKPEGKKVSLFVYQEHAGAGKHHSSNLPRILALGPNIKTHPRHYLQQGEYTLCTKYERETWQLASHSSVFESGNKDQDRLWKFTVPASEADAVMNRLGEYNITSYSLFQSEESLLQTLARQYLSVARK